MAKRELKKGNTTNFVDLHILKGSENVLLLSLRVFHIVFNTDAAKLRGSRILFFFFISAYL